MREELKTSEGKIRLLEEENFTIKEEGSRLAEVAEELRTNLADTEQELENIK